MKLFDAFFEYLGIILLFVNAGLYIKSYSTYKGAVALKYFSIYILLIFIIQFIAITLAFYEIRNLYLSHFYFLIQFVLLSLFYKALFTKKQQLWVVITLILVVLALSIQYAFNPSIYYNFNILEIFLCTFPLIVYSIVHLYNSLSISNKFMFINAGVLMYLTTSTLIYILGDYITSNSKNNTTINIWFLNKILYVGFLLLILVEWKKSILPLKNK